ncbi:hypothetical protein [Lactobacillus phage Lbab1]|nr:hypothetical protein [Lactobacillus phage Lbab1]
MEKYESWKYRPYGNVYTKKQFVDYLQNKEYGTISIASLSLCGVSYLFHISKYKVDSVSYSLNFKRPKEITKNVYVAANYVVNKKGIVNQAGYVTDQVKNRLAVAKDIYKSLYNSYIQAENELVKEVLKKSASIKSPMISKQGKADIIKKLGNVNPNVSMEKSSKKEVVRLPSMLYHNLYYVYVGGKFYHYDYNEKPFKKTEEVAHLFKLMDPGTPDSIESKHNVDYIVSTIHSSNLDNCEDFYIREKELYDLTSSKEKGKEEKEAVTKPVEDNKELRINSLTEPYVQIPPESAPYLREKISKLVKINSHKGSTKRYTITIPAPLKGASIQLNVYRGSATIRYSSTKGSGNHKKSFVINKDDTLGSIKKTVEENYKDVNIEKRLESGYAGNLSSGDVAFLMKEYPAVYYLVDYLSKLLNSHEETDVNSKTISSKKVVQKKQKDNRDRGIKVMAGYFSKVSYNYQKTKGLYLYDHAIHKRFNNWKDLLKEDKRGLKNMQPVKTHRPVRETTIQKLKNQPEAGTKYIELVKQEKKIYNKLNSSWVDRVKYILFK